MTSILDLLDELVEKFWDKISYIMPSDPLKPLINQLSVGSLSEYIGYINYFFPVGFFLKAFSAFLVSLAAYYIVIVVLRWIKAVS